MPHARFQRSPSLPPYGPAANDNPRLRLVSGSAAAVTVDIAYDSTWVRLPETITTHDALETLTYTSSGNLETRTIEDTTTHTVPYVTDGETRTWEFTYTSSGQLASAQLPRAQFRAHNTD